MPLSVFHFFNSIPKPGSLLPIGLRHHDLYHGIISDVFVPLIITEASGLFFTLAVSL
jgi:hypothetical protein